MYRSSPANPAMKPATSSRPCIDSAASWWAAIQPSVRPSRGGDVAGGQTEAGDVVEVGRHLVEGEAQVGGTDLDQLATRAQAGQGQCRVLAGADHQVHLRREVLQQERHAGLDVGAVDEVVVVEHQPAVVRHGAELIEHRGEDGLDRWLARLQERERARADAWHHRLQGRDQVGPVRRGLAVALLKGQPGHGALAIAGGRLLGQQGRLAEAGRAETSVRRDSAPRRRRPLSRGRATRLRRSFGG